MNTLPAEVWFRIIGRCAVTDCPTEGPINAEGVCAACAEAQA